jgi:uncharacterized membrane protein
MRKAEIAELILSLFTSRDRAASTVGDLEENTTGRGARWFWLGVFRTASSLFWSSFAAEPLFIASIGFRGLVLNLSCYLVLFICMLVLASVFGLFAGLHFISLSAANSLSLGWVFSLVGRIAVCTVQFQTGRWIARRARDKEMAACAAFLIVQTMVMQIMGEFLFGGRWLGALTSGPHSTAAPITGASLAIDNLMSLIALFSGAIWVRRRFVNDFKFTGI